MDMKIANCIAPVFILAFVFASLIVLPAYCNRIESGSTIDISSGSITTSASDRFIQYSGGLNPVEFRYSLNVNGISPESPAQGSASAYIDGLIQEGSSDSLDPSLAERIEFHEFTSVSGAITRFEKVMQFNSGNFI
jgi:hypothetical protein